MRSRVKFLISVDDYFDICVQYIAARLERSVIAF